MELPEVVSRSEWLSARKRLLIEEKEFTHARDELSAQRRRLPMVRIDKAYEFGSPQGTMSLLDLFEGRRQLILHHFMWTYDEDGQPLDEGCPSCSATADDIGNLTALHVRGTTLAAVSRAPAEKLERYRERMGWTFPWYSSAGSDFNLDFHTTVDDRDAPVQMNFRDKAELAAAGQPWTPAQRGDCPSISAFLRDGDTVFHTYQTFARGLEFPGGSSYYLDLTALGRQEDWEEPKGRTTGLGAGAGTVELRRHDKYTPEQLAGRG